MMSGTQFSSTLIFKSMRVGLHSYAYLLESEDTHRSLAIVDMKFNYIFEIYA